MSQIVKHLAKLAALEIPDSEMKGYEEQLSEIFEYMDQIKELDLEMAPETYRTTEEENVLRDDKIEPSLTQEQALENAKKTHEGFFLVPAILKDTHAS